jgi:hypothetical protein
MGITKFLFLSNEPTIITSQRNVILNFVAVRTWNLLPCFSKFHFNIIPHRFDYMHNSSNACIY